MARDEDDFDSGLRLFEAGDFPGAEARLSQVTGEPAVRGQALILLGRLYLKTKRAPEAERSLLQALQIRRSGEAYLLLGEALKLQAKLAPAEAAYKEALRREARDPEPCLMLGHVYSAQGRLEEAVLSYEQALLRDHTSTSARFHLAVTLLNAGNVPRANTQLHYLLQREPDYVPGILLRGDMAFAQEDYRQAVVEYCRAMERETPDGPVFERLGQAFEAISDFDQSLKAFETSIQAHPTYGPCYLEAARIYERRKWLRKAHRYYQAVALDPACQQEATEAIARIDAHFAQFDLSEASPDDPPVESEFEPVETEFKPPETLNRGTRPLDPSLVPWAPGSSKRDGWVSSNTGKLPEKKDPAQPPDSKQSVGRKLLKATGDLLPDGLKGLFKRPDR